MIVYSDRKRSFDTRVVLAALVGALAAPDPDAAALLIEAGMLEAGVADALLPKEDDEPEPLPTFGAAMLDLAHAARGKTTRLASARKGLAGLAAGPLPAKVEVSEPEGFAFYALYPDSYAEAARRFLEAERPEQVTVVGLRSIGTTLSAVVMAEIEAWGVTARRLIVRPRGHPWDRELQLSASLRRALAEAGHVLVVDEGPGISGTSFASAAEAAEGAGVPDERIHLIPSWDADGSGLRSNRARVRWGRHRRWVASFEETHLVNGRLAASWGGGELRDLSGGLWRNLLYPKGQGPAAQPQHERRKYLAGQSGEPLLLKFAGLGARGSRALARAEAQAEARLAPAVAGLSDGFLAYRFAQGVPVSHADKGVLEAMGRYLAWLATNEVQDGTPRFDDILQMIHVNVTEGLGKVAAGRAGWMEGQRALVEARSTLAVDGRMLPQEWLRTADGLRKCDGIDHHNDHFWPGMQDIAWDLCGAAVEFGLTPAAREHLLADFEARTGDTGARRVMPFYEIAYLAWRMGYTALAAETLGTSKDGLRMGRERDRYATLLLGALQRRDG